LNHSAWLGISLMDAMLRLNLVLPGATLPCPNFPQQVCYAGVLAYILCIVFCDQSSRPLLRFVVPPVIILITLVWGVALA